MGGSPARGHAYPEQFAADMDLAPFNGAPRIYLIASTPRCGSHFLGHALARTGHFGVPLEYLGDRNLTGWRARFGPEDDAAILRHLIACRTSPSGWFGIKAHWSQFERCADRALFAAHGGVDRTIFLYRRDLLAQAISYLRAAQSGQFISGAARQAEPRYDCARILARARSILSQNRAWSRYLREEFDNPVLTVVYEDLVADQPSGFAAIGQFLDPDCPMRPAPSARTAPQSDASPKPGGRRRSRTSATPTIG